jgi:glutathione-independent formaldehyde dehydrogenase
VSPRASSRSSHDLAINDHLRDAVVHGRINPGTIFSHRLPLNAAADAFEKFDARTNGYIKVVLEP